MSIIDTSLLVHSEGSSVEIDGSSPDQKLLSSSRMKLPKTSSTLVAALRSKLDTLKVGFAIATAAALPFSSGCSKSGSDSFGAQGPNSPSAVSQSILPITPDTKISIEQSVKIAQALSSLSSDLKVVHKNIGVLQKVVTQDSLSVEKTEAKGKATAQSNLERSTKIALLGTEQALNYVPTNQTFNALQLALKQVAQASKGDTADNTKVLADASKTIEAVGKGISDIIERMGPAEHVVQLMDLRLNAQTAHKEISSMLSALGTLPEVPASNGDYPKVQKAGHEAEFAAKVFKDASTNTFFSSLSAELTDVGNGLNTIATNTVSYAAYTNAFNSAEKVAMFKNDSSQTLGKLSVVYDKVGEELSSLGSLGVIQMMTAPSAGISTTSNAAAVTTNVVTVHHSHPVFMYHTYWRPWYGGYYYDGPSHYSAGLWSGFSSSRPTTSHSSSVHSSTLSPSTGVASGVGSAPKPGTFGIAHGFGSTTSAKSGFTSSSASAAHGEGGAHVSGTSGGSAHVSSSGSSGGKSSSAGHSGGFGGGAAGHGSSFGG